MNRDICDLKRPEESKYNWHMHKYYNIIDLCFSGLTYDDAKIIRYHINNSTMQEDEIEAANIIVDTLVELFYNDSNM